MGGAPRRVSEVCERYVTQQGSVGTWTGLGFNLCVAPTLTFCPCILGIGMNWGSGFKWTSGLGCEDDAWYDNNTWFQTEAGTWRAWEVGMQGVQHKEVWGGCRGKIGTRGSQGSRCQVWGGGEGESTGGDNSDADPDLYKDNSQLHHFIFYHCLITQPTLVPCHMWSSDSSIPSNNTYVDPRVHPHAMFWCPWCPPCPGWAIWCASYLSSPSSLIFIQWQYPSSPPTIICHWR